MKATDFLASSVCYLIFGSGSRSGNFICSWAAVVIGKCGFDLKSLRPNKDV